MVQVVTGDSQEEVIIFRDRQTDRHIIIIYISATSDHVWGKLLWRIWSRRRGIQSTNPLNTVSVIINIHIIVGILTPCCWVNTPTPSLACSAMPNHHRHCHQDQHDKHQHPDLLIIAFFLLQTVIRKIPNETNFVGHF